MASGGKRDGAGRKAGSLTQRNQEILKQAALDGITPLEVILNVMRELYLSDMRYDRVKACELARIAAPYIHPRINAISMNDEDSANQQTI